jgi:hypothetical protein
MKLTLANFRGIRELGIDFCGVSANIYGRNGTGKTTIANAIWWVLYGKAIDGEKGFTPKTRNGEQDAHGLNNSAELTIKTGDGVVITLKKVFCEKYTTQKGSADAVFSGHTTDHFIDNIPVKEKDYADRISNIIGDALMAKILSNVNEFAGVMTWEDRRRILVSVCGDVSDADVIAANPELSKLPSILAMPGSSNRQYIIDEYAKIAKAKLAEIRREKDLIPARIDEADRAIKAVPENPPKDVDADIAAINKLIEATDIEIVNARAAKTDEAAAALRLEIKGVEMEIATVRTAAAKAQSERNAGVYAQISEIGEKIARADIEVATLSSAVSASTQKIFDMVKRRNELLTNDADIRAMMWDASQEVCPTCLRALAHDKVDALRAEFNRRKSEKLAAITAQGRQECSKDMIAELEALRDGDKAKYESMCRVRNALVSERDALKEQIDVSADICAYEDTENYKALAARLEALGRQEQEGDAAAAQANAAKIANIDTKKAEMLKERDRLCAIKEAIDSGKRQSMRISELKEQLRALAVEDETLQRHLHICELFDTAKMTMLDEAINSKFTAVKFRMFVQQLNGGIRKDCEVLVPSKDGSAWVPYSGGSNRGANVNAGLEIISVLSKHWGRSMPVIVDNAESVSDWVDTDVQLIQLIVTRTDDKLRVEVQGNASGEIAKAKVA